MFGNKESAAYRNHHQQCHCRWGSRWTQHRHDRVHQHLRQRLRHRCVASGQSHQIPLACHQQEFHLRVCRRRPYHRLVFHQRAPEAEWLRVSSYRTWNHKRQLGWYCRRRLEHWTSWACQRMPSTTYQISDKYCLAPGSVCSESKWLWRRPHSSRRSTTELATC